MLVFSAYATFLVFPTTQAAQQNVQGSSDNPALQVAKEVFRQIDGVTDFTAQAFQAVVSSSVRAEQQEALDGVSLPEPIPVVSTQFPLSGVELGKLIINAPLSLTNTLTSSDLSYFATTSVEGLLTTDALEVNGSLDVTDLNASGTVSASLVDAGSLSGSRLSVRGAAQVNTLDVAAAAELGSLVVADQTQLASLLVSDAATLADMTVNGTADIAGLLRATGGIDTNGADINLADGKIFASNIVNEVVAGDGVDCHRLYVCSDYFG